LSSTAARLNCRAFCSVGTQREQSKSEQRRKSYVKPYHGRHRTLLEDETADCLRALTANLLRITRGAGRPQDLYQEMALCLEAMQNHKQTTGRPISASAIRAMLDWDRSGSTSARQASHAEERDLGWERLLFLRNITQASLQRAVSSLLRQNTQFSQGQVEVFSAVKRYEEAHKRETKSAYRRSRRDSGPDDANDRRYCRFDTSRALPRAIIQLH